MVDQLQEGLGALDRVLFKAPYNIQVSIRNWPLPLRKDNARSTAEQSKWLR